MNHPWTLLGLSSRMHQTWVTKTFLKVNFLAPCLEIQLGLQSCPLWDLAGSGPCQQSGSRTHSTTLSCELIHWVPCGLPALILAVSTAIFVFKHIFREFQFTFKIEKLIEDLVSREPGELKSIQENCTIWWTLTFLALLGLLIKW